MVRAGEGEDGVVDLPWWFGARLARGCCNRELHHSFMYLPTSIIDTRGRIRIKAGHKDDTGVKTELPCNLSGISACADRPVHYMTVNIMFSAKPRLLELFLEKRVVSIN